MLLNIYWSWAHKIFPEICEYEIRSSTSLCCYGDGKLCVLPSFRDIFALPWTCSRKDHGGFQSFEKNVYHFVMMNWILGHFELFKMWLVERLSSNPVCILIIIFYYSYVNLNDLSFTIDKPCTVNCSELLKQLEYSQGSRVVSLLLHNSCEVFYSICTIVATLWLFHLVSVPKCLKGTLRLDWFARIWMK